ncbi:hypothetical protein [Croceibacterium ferulae]|uniref:hypothetical protein n=1 Tax=Croceibacterium ferulae TaxID=1854641 RepID=UPI000EAD180F|nr:hypothetical protein [Croceibacterium ferulae]
MNIQVLVQGEQWLNRAGVRIRYRRIAPHLLPLGSSLSVDVIGAQVNRDRVGADVVILSKCTDARGLTVAEVLREKGVIVGVDLFDDYFSTRTGPCLPHREMLRQMAKRVDFFLCSTARMQQVSRQFAPDMPVHVLNDPFDDFDKDALARQLNDKAKSALANRKFEVLWFGNGDNPVFPVGLEDLAAFSASLRKLAGGGFDVNLRVLTNLRALGVHNLARLRNLPVPTTIEEWSEERERECLKQALVSFIPVNFQNFSIAKSLNRGISALTGGTQVLSPGYQLYDKLGSFLYHEPNRLLDDLAAGTLRLRPATLDPLGRQMNDLADPGTEAARLCAFVRELDAARAQTVIARPKQRFSRAVLHGRTSVSSVDGLCRQVGWLSIASPFTSSKRPFDVNIGFFGDRQTVHIRFSREGLKFVRPEWRSSITDFANPSSNFAGGMDVPDGPGATILRRLRPAMIETRAGRILHYASVIQATEDIIGRILEDTALTLSEKENPLMSLGSAPFRAITAG